MITFRIIKTKKMKQSRKKFIIEAHENACNEWKQKIEKEFPKLFKKDKLRIEVGKWYKCTRTPHLAFIFSITDERYYYFGINAANKLKYKDYYPLEDIIDLRIATKKEIKDFENKLNEKLI